MSNQFIEIFGRQFKHHTVLGVAALNVAALSEFSSNVTEAVSKRPSARTPDTPSSTR